MNIFTSDTDWRTKVASMTAADDLDIEKTFSDIASGFVANKVGDLMKDEHRVGFEIVKKNDDNTRMIGMFAFKVDKELIFAPVFFLAGEIKGPLLYRCDSKQFVPATKAWASYLIESMEMTEGKGIDKSLSAENTPRVEINRLLMRPKSASIKAASVEEFGEDVEEGLKDAICKQASAGLLKEFLQEQDYGKVAADLIVKAASSEDSDDFVEHLARLYGDAGNLIPDTFTVTEEQVKEAHTLELVYGFDKYAAVDDKSAKQYWKDGFYLYDNRYLKDTCKVYINETLDDIQCVNDAGKYNILKEDGNFINDCVCVRVFKEEKDTWACPRPTLIGGNVSADKDNYILIIKDGNVLLTDKALGVPQQTDTTDSLANVGTENVSEDELYVAKAAGNDSVSQPFFVVNKKVVDGVTYCDVVPVDTYKLGSARTLYIYTGDSKQMVINKDVDSNVFDKFEFGKNVRFIKINTADVSHGHYCCERDAFVSSNKKDRHIEKQIKQIDDVVKLDKATDWVYNKFNLPTLKITFTKSASYPYVIEDVMAKQASIRLNRKEMLIKLAQDLHISAQDSYDIVDKAEQNGSVNFMYTGMDKLASRVHIVERPMWRDHNESETGLPQSEPQRFVLGIAADQNFADVPRVGDALNPITATGLPSLTVTTTAPEQLRSLADTYKLPHVFEFGMVGTLADTFDANHLVTKYIPKLQEGLDCLGRIKFLFYWKPDDFERQYGSDDLVNLEGRIDSEFEQLGELVLNLLKKADRQKDESNSNSRSSNNN